MIIDYNICPALQTVLNKLFDAGKFFFCDLGNIIGDRFAVFVEISIEIWSLIVQPFKFPELNPVFTELDCVNLRNSYEGYNDGKENDKNLLECGSFKR